MLWHISGKFALNHVVCAIVFTETEVGQVLGMNVSPGSAGGSELFRSLVPSDCQGSKGGRRQFSVCHLSRLTTLYRDTM
ncbi:hypothetical protein IW261DRAFT_1512275 [Armillaria novae-zelandiae]|uniref:Secreted protein n=1 Tax=Armillaria novae-zelandiae TaxID=153914 RepID=A0AA39T890_9AGAR|nr:hypothetical protein IW261DRAFT_1512275 [Armillaria novae-zelandiae]